MSGVAIDDMSPAPAAYRPSLQVPEWPTAEQVGKRDHRHALILERPSQHLNLVESRSAIRLASKLRPDRTESPVPTTLASQRYVHELKDRVCGHLWEEVCRSQDARFFTLIPRDGDVHLNDLSGFDPVRLRERLRDTFNESGARASTGFVLAVMEAEYQIQTSILRFHWHGIATGHKLIAIDKMRSVRRFQTTKCGDDPARRVARRIKISRRPLYSLPDPLTYLIKPWFARWTSPAGTRGRRRKIPDHVLPASLLWLDQWTLSDLTLMMGIRCKFDGFSLIKSKREHGARSTYTA